MTNHPAEETTFWTLLQNYTVEIPKIQRDYAQGRTDEKTRLVADAFLDSIKTAVCESKPLNLDFIYGKTENKVLIPIDGQQRLTTLFLLHWYAAAKEQKLDKDVQCILSKFTYETRLSSRDFCKGLINKSIDSFSGNSVKTIKDSPWYFLSWEHDPTVCAMLTMIERIDTHFKDCAIPLFEQLTGSDSSKTQCPITFYFLPLEHFQLSDELYIRMNARGKQLTEFEHFKVLFSEYLANPEEKAKLDNEWLDIFWTHARRQAEKNRKEISSDMTDTVDRYFFAFFALTGRQFYAEKQGLSKNDDFSLLREYRTIYEDSTAVQKTIHILNALCSYEDSESFFAAILDNPAPTYHEQLRFYALAQYLIWKESLHSSNDEPLIIYKQWMRVTVNLINNTLVGNAEDYGKAVQSINTLSAYMTNLYPYLQEKGTEISFFYGDQTKEEKEKAARIVEDPAWEDVLIKAERHEYFDRQIGFILNYAKTANGYDMQQFQTYAEKLAILFSTQFREKYETENTADRFLFQRALLHYGNYLPKDRYNYTFCEFTPSLRAKNENWRKVFNDEKRVLILKALLDAIPNGTPQTIAAALKAIIAESNTGDWRHLFIKEPRHIDYCEQRYIRFYPNNPDDPHAKIYLISRKQLNSYHHELYSYHLFLNVFDGIDYPPFTQIWYYESTSYEEPCIAIDKFFYPVQGTEYHFHIDIVHEGNRSYTIKFGERNQRTLPPEITTVLKQAGFNDNAVMSGIPEAEVKGKKEEMAKRLAHAV